MDGRLSMLALACTCVCAVLVSGAAAATIHGVKATRESQHYWGLHPHENITIGVGGQVVFRTAKMFHDVSVVATPEEWTTCDVSNAIQWVDTMGNAQVEGVENAVVDEYGMYHFTYNATTPGTFWVLCTVENGKHCKAEQKLLLTVTDTPSTDVAQVMARDVPFWTVAVMYEDITMPLGDSLSFVSDNQGYHDVALLKTDECSSPDYACCAGASLGNAVQTTLYKRTDYISNQEYVWTPDAAGTYEVVCTVCDYGPGTCHCLFGQRVKVTVTTVTAPSLPSPPPTSGSAPGLRAVTALLMLAACALLL